MNQISLDFDTLVDESPTETPKKVLKGKLVDRCSECGRVAKEIARVDMDDTLTIITLECGHIISKERKALTSYTDFMTHEHRGNDCEHEWDKNHCTLCDAHRLFPFQVESAEFIERALELGRGAGIFHEMGLGKTVIALAYLAQHPERFPTLFVVKSAVKFQFFKEIIRWLGVDHVSQVITTGRDRVLPGLKTYIISYDLIKTVGKEMIMESRFKSVVLDECQQIKNPDSQRTQAVRDLLRDCECVIPLSGTPWKNRGSEFFTALNLIAPAKFPTLQGFLTRWVDYRYSGGKYKEAGIRNPKRFQDFISDIAIRKQRTEVLPELPTVDRTAHYMELDELQQQGYDDQVTEFVQWFEEKVIDGEEENFENQGSMMAQIARMRHMTGLCKIPTTVDLVTDHIKDVGRKIVIFVHHQDVGQLMLEELSKRLPGLPLLKLTSEMNAGHRMDAQERFNRLPLVVMVASTVAAGEGMNLQTCCDCILHERQWNPANEEQAESRFTRIGSKATSVSARYILASGTVDELLTNIVEPKRLDFHKAMNKGEPASWNHGATMSELAESIVRTHRERRSA